MLNNLQCSLSLLLLGLPRLGIGSLKTESAMLNENVSVECGIYLRGDP
jgi:hypothetical protein